MAPAAPAPRQDQPQAQDLCSVIPESTRDSNLSEQSKQENNRKLTYIDGIAIVVGIIIGSGIFSSPGLALERSGSPGADLIAWAVSGMLVTLAAQCYLELAGMMPSAGGDFDFLGRAYGERAAFSFAWFNFFVSKTGSQAIIATIFGRYFESVLRGNTSALKDDSSADETVTSKILAVTVIVLMTGLNCAGVKESAWASIVLTSTKVVLVLLVFIFAVAYASSSKVRGETFNTNLGITNSFQGSNSIFEFGTSMVACLWCYDGFADGNFLQEEMVDPVRDMPRIIRVGLLLVTCCYILTNIGYLSVLSYDTITDTKAIAVQFGDTVSDMFKTGRDILPNMFALGVSLSTLGAVNGSIMTGGRAIYAVARAGKFPAQLAKINSRGSPYMSLIAQGAWSIVLLLIPGSNFSTLLDYFGPTSWLFYGFSASAVIRLRYIEPDTIRPFKVPFYPLPPLVVITLAMVIFISSLIESPLFTLLALGFVVMSYPIHLLMERYGYFPKVGGGKEDVIASGTNIVTHSAIHHTPLSQVED
jgi:amino acid transporter